MIDWIIRQLFKWESLRVAIFAEVDLDNSIARILEDPESMKTASAMWCEPDGWRGWTIKDNNTYYFHDIPENTLGDIFNLICKEEDNEMHL